ncbi:MAG: Xaa-Pro dipeptidase [Bdellovibrionales bacterium]|nr:Xaa-Pro dipeptidase [Bdellovibrionales bacterium]NQZ20163.1 Xaa-Pro dipeptidase [Bdellovibrionales bacterium]
MEALFKDHINQRLNYVRGLLEAKNLDSLIIDSGLPDYYFHDDQHIPFKPNPHFLHYVPESSPGHILQINKNGKSCLSYFIPDDFWHEVASFDQPFWAEHFDVKIVNSEERVWESLNTATGSHVVLTPHSEKAEKYNLALVDDSFLSALNWSRIEKSEFEIQCIKEANKKASLGHLAAKEAFFNGLSEREVFQNYLMASNQFQFELPYGNITAFNEKAAILHYQNTRNFKNGDTFLIDAGATHYGYCSDITRTYFKDNVHEVFKTLHAGIEKSQQEMCSMVKPGFDYEKIQDKAHEDIADLLINTDIIRASKDQTLDLDLVSPFFPHGIGHALGLQVHDVGGKQLNEQGEPSPRSEKHPFLRTLREIQNNDVLTIEPGVYFIPMLLNDIKVDSEKKALLNWDLIDQLFPLGGIRIEDDVVARANGSENLTRPFLP